MCQLAGHMHISFEVNTNWPQQYNSFTWAICQHILCKLKGIHISNIVVRGWHVFLCLPLTMSLVLQTMGFIFVEDQAMSLMSSVYLTMAVTCVLSLISLCRHLHLVLPIGQVKPFLFQNLECFTSRYCLYAHNSLYSDTVHMTWCGQPPQS